jgi:hypothetical protein
MKVEELKKHKDGLYTSLSRDLDAFEKNFILIASGLLAFSITFIKDIVKIETADLILFLFGGWLLILAAIGVMMFAFLSSVNGSNELWKTTDEYIIANNLYKADEVLDATKVAAFKTIINPVFYKIKKRLKRMRAWAVGLFIGGVLLFAAFVSINLYNENSKAKTKTIDKPKHKTEIIIEKAIMTTTDSILIIKNTKVQPQVQTPSQHNRSNRSANQ